MSLGLVNDSKLKYPFFASAIVGAFLLIPRFLDAMAKSRLEYSTGYAAAILLFLAPAAIVGWRRGLNYVPKLFINVSIMLNLLGVPILIPALVSLVVVSLWPRKLDY
jgi:hypothetical protein